MDTNPDADEADEDTSVTTKIARQRAFIGNVAINTSGTAY